MATRSASSTAHSNNDNSNARQPSLQPDSVGVAAARAYLEQLQTRICDTLADIDGTAAFARDHWQRQAGGGGITRVLHDGDVFEQAGVAFSHIHGDELPAPASANRPELAGRSFQAMGVSLVIHPRNPNVPTSHANVRMFVAAAKDQPPLWWFGGGYDLTPFYPELEDIQHWHHTARAACEPFGADVYARYKDWCDRYFYLRHRDETRGVGGLFYDDLNEWPFATCFAFMQAVGDSYLDAYTPIVRRRMDQSYDEQQREFQLYRRGRYVEFNLLYDRGTLFGLQSGGRTESILMSMPPMARWHYNWQPHPDSREAVLYRCLQARDWLHEEAL